MYMQACGTVCQKFTAKVISHPMQDRQDVTYLCSPIVISEVQLSGRDLDGFLEPPPGELSLFSRRETYGVFVDVPFVIGDSFAGGNAVLFKAEVDGVEDGDFFVVLVSIITGKGWKTRGEGTFFVDYDKLELEAEGEGF